MRKFFIQTVLLTTVSLVLSSSYAATDKVLATLNGKPIVKESDIQKFRDSAPAAANLTNKQITELLADQYVLEDFLKTTPVSKDPKYDFFTKTAVNQAGSQIYIMDYVSKTMTDDELKKVYKDEIESKSFDEVKVKHILVKTEEEAKSISARLKKNPASFDSIAKNESLDKGSAERGGELGFIRQGQTVPEFDNYIFSNPKMNVASEPIKSQFGYHIIKVLEVKKGEKPSFESVKEQLSAAAANKKFESQVKQYKDQKLKITLE